MASRMPSLVTLGAPLGASQAAGGGAPAETVLVHDTFTGTDSTLLTAHTPDVDVVGVGWLTVSGTSSNAIISNQAYAPSGKRANRINAGVADGVLTLDLINAVLGTAYTQILFRKSGNDHWQALRSASTWFLHEFVSGVTTVRDSAASPYSSGANVALKVVLNGNSIQFLIDDVVILEYSSSVLATATHYGFGAENSTERFDNFKVVA